MNKRNYFLFSGMFIVAILVFFILRNNDKLDKTSWDNITIGNSGKKLGIITSKKSYKVIIDKNLFHPDRSLSKKDLKGKSSISKKKKQTFNVIGVFIFGKQKYVTLQERNKKEQNDYTIGETIKNTSYKVKEITSNKVILANNTKDEITLDVK